MAPPQAMSCGKAIASSMLARAEGEHDQPIQPQGDTRARRQPVREGRDKALVDLHPREPGVPAPGRLRLETPALLGRDRSSS